MRDDDDDARSIEDASHQKRRSKGSMSADEAMDGVRCELLFCGATDWHNVGRNKTNPDGGPYTDLNEPHAFEPLLGKTWTRVGGGAAATHAAAIDDEGRCTRGDQTAGRLGHGDYKNRGTPTLVEALRDEKCVAVACGKSHTAVVCENGDVYRYRIDKFGQIGCDTMKKQMKGDIEDDKLTPVKALVANGASVSCGRFHRGLDARR